MHARAREDAASKDAPPTITATKHGPTAAPIDAMNDPDYAEIRATYHARYGSCWWYNDHVFGTFVQACNAAAQENAAAAAAAGTPTTAPAEFNLGDPMDTPQDTLHICGPITTAFPRTKGWAPTLTAAHDQTQKMKSLPMLTIKRITHYFTYPHTERARPNCEANWQAKFSVPIPWKKIWPSLGTKISDATEERVWRIQLHRGTRVRNRMMVPELRGAHLLEARLRLHRRRAEGGAADDAKGSNTLQHVGEEHARI